MVYDYLEGINSPKIFRNYLLDFNYLELLLVLFILGLVVLSSLNLQLILRILSVGPEVHQGLPLVKRRDQIVAPKKEQASI